MKIGTRHILLSSEHAKWIYVVFCLYFSFFCIYCSLLEVYTPHSPLLWNPNEHQHKLVLASLCVIVPHLFWDSTFQHHSLWNSLHNETHLYAFYIHINTHVSHYMNTAIEDEWDSWRCGKSFIHQQPWWWWFLWF